MDVPELANPATSSVRHASSNTSAHARRGSSGGSPASGSGAGGRAGSSSEADSRRRSHVASSLQQLARVADAIRSNPAKLDGGAAPLAALHGLRSARAPPALILTCREMQALLRAIADSAAKHPDAWQAKYIARCANELTSLAKHAPGFASSGSGSGSDGGSGSSGGGSGSSGSSDRQARQRGGPTSPAALLVDAVSALAGCFAPRLHTVPPAYLAGVLASCARVGVRETPLHAAAAAWLVSAELAATPSDHSSSINSSGSGADGAGWHERLRVFLSHVDPHGDWQRAAAEAAEAAAYRSRRAGRHAPATSPLEGTTLETLIQLLWSYARVPGVVQRYEPLLSVLLHRMLAAVQAGGSSSISSSSSSTRLDDSHHVSEFASVDDSNIGAGSESEELPPAFRWQPEDEDEQGGVAGAAGGDAHGGEESAAAHGSSSGAHKLSGDRCPQVLASLAALQLPLSAVAASSAAATASSGDEALGQQSLPQLAWELARTVLHQLQADAGSLQPRQVASAAQAVVSLGVSGSEAGAAALAAVVEHGATFLRPQALPAASPYVSLFKPTELGLLLLSLAAHVRAVDAAAAAAAAAATAAAATGTAQTQPFALPAPHAAAAACAPLDSILSLSSHTFIPEPSAAPVLESLRSAISLFAAVSQPAVVFNLPSQSPVWTVHMLAAFSAIHAPPPPLITAVAKLLRGGSSGGGALPSDVGPTALVALAWALSRAPAVAAAAAAASPDTPALYIRHSSEAVSSSSADAAGGSGAGLLSRYPAAAAVLSAASAAAPPGSPRNSHNTSSSSHSALSRSPHALLCAVAECLLLCVQDLSASDCASLHVSLAAAGIVHEPLLAATAEVACLAASPRALVHWPLAELQAAAWAWSVLAVRPLPPTTTSTTSTTNSSGSSTSTCSTATSRQGDVLALLTAAVQECRRRGAPHAQGELTLAAIAARSSTGGTSVSATGAAAVHSPATTNGYASSGYASSGYGSSGGSTNVLEQLQAVLRRAHSGSAGTTTSSSTSTTAAAAASAASASAGTASYTYTPGLRTAEGLYIDLACIPNGTAAVTDSIARPIAVLLHREATDGDSGSSGSAGSAGSAAAGAASLRAAQQLWQRDLLRAQGWIVVVVHTSSFAAATSIAAKLRYLQRAGLPLPLPLQLPLPLSPPPQVPAVGGAAPAVQSKQQRVRGAAL